MTVKQPSARVAALVDRQVSPDELRQALQVPLSEEEREDILALARWFRRRYPTPLERLAYVRRSHRRWLRLSGLARRIE
jgi:hypothetical protein